MAEFLCLFPVSQPYPAGEGLSQHHWGDDLAAPYEAEFDILKQSHSSNIQFVGTRTMISRNKPLLKGRDERLSRALRFHPSYRSRSDPSDGAPLLRGERQEPAHIVAGRAL